MNYPHQPLLPEWRLIAVIAILALVLMILVVLAIVGFVVHLVFSPWLLVAAIGILAWMKFRPRRSR